MTPASDDRERRPRPDADHVRSQLREQPAPPEPAEPDATDSQNGHTEEAARAARAGDQEPPTLSSDGDGDGPGGAQPAEEGGAEEAAAAAEQQDEDPLAQATRERDEYLALARRTQADFENYRKRTAKDLAAAGGRARVGLIRELLPVVDNLERALASSADGEGEDGLAEGVRLVLADLQGVLARAGVEAIEPAGVKFDPTVHEALTMREQEGADSGVVLDVVEKGYRTGETVIRPARVVVAA